MNNLITFADVNILPKWSEIPSRADVNLSMNRAGFPYMTLPVIAANMDTVCEANMAKAMLKYGAQACLHRFCSIEENVKMFNESRIINDAWTYQNPMVSIGLGQSEIERAEALRDAGAITFIIDVNNGANIAVVKQARLLRSVLGSDFGIVVGNFATGATIETFLENAGGNIVDGFKVGIGGGSTCTTRVKTGVGVPQLSALLDCRPAIVANKMTMIADGAMKTAGDVAKALAAGAHMVMTGGMLAGTDETPGDIFYETASGQKILRSEDNKHLDDPSLWNHGYVKLVKKYRGSASQESYEKQGKIAKHRTAEGEAFYIPYRGPVENVLQDIEGGLRGSLSMVGAWSLNDYHKLAEFVRVSPASAAEAHAHGRTK